MVHSGFQLEIFVFSPPLIGDGGKGEGEQGVCKESRIRK